MRFKGGLELRPVANVSADGGDGWAAGVQPRFRRQCPDRQHEQIEVGGGELLAEEKRSLGLEFRLDDVEEPVAMLDRPLFQGLGRLGSEI